MKRLATLTWKELLHLRRDRITLRMIVMIPLLQTMIFGFAINFDVRHMRTVVLDEDRSFESRELVARFVASGYFDPVAVVDSLPELRHAIDAGQARVGLVVDRDFGRDLRRGDPARAQLVVDASDTVVSGQAMSVASGIANGVSFRILAAKAEWTGDAPPIDLRVRPWYNPELRTANFIIPGLVAIILTFTLIQFTAMAIVRERERGTLEQLQVTPVTRTELILGKILPFLGIGVLQLTLVVVLMRLVFRVPVVGSLASLYAASLLFIAAVLGLGMLISTVATTQMQAMQLSFFFLLPFVFLSGYVFPIEGMPTFFRVITYLIPARYYIEIIRGIVLRGAGLADLWPQVGLLTVYTVGIIALAVARFRKTAR